MIRPLQPEDVPGLVVVQHATFDDLARRMGLPTHDLTDEVRARGAARIGHLQRTDPGSAWAAEVDGELAGCALAMVRDGMWFLSLLIVSPRHQGTGVGRALLDAALTTATERSWILSTVEPAAVRRYQRAGFALHPTYTAKGLPDRAQLPAVSGIREGGEEDRDTLDQVARHLRGVALGSEVDFLHEHGVRFLVSPGRGFVVLRDSGPIWLGAVDVPTARALLWSSLAETTGPAEVNWLGADQQWAIDVCLDARLTLGAGGSICLRGQPPMSPYLPNGAFG